MKVKNVISWILRIISAVILLQTLYFKFTGHPQSVEIFSKLGVEPWGRIATGVIELLTGILLLVPSTAFIGALLGIGLMLGAIGSHIAVTGIESMMDGGTLFILAVIVLACCMFTSFSQKEQCMFLRKKLLGIKTDKSALRF